MRTIWRFDGLLIVLTGITAHGDPAFEGYAVTKSGEVRQWEAVAKSKGYVVHLDNSRAGFREFQGSTFNLGLEVSAALSR